MRKIMLMAAVIAALMATTSTAMADTYIEVTDPATGNPCDSVTYTSQTQSVTGGCSIAGLNSVGDATRVGSGSVWCHINFGSLRVDSAGAFYLSSIAFVQGSPAWCNNVQGACRDANNQQVPWSGQIVSTGGGEYRADVTGCVKILNGPSTGPMPLTFDITEHESSFQWERVGMLWPSEFLGDGDWSSEDSGGDTVTITEHEA